MPSNIVLSEDVVTANFSGTIIKGEIKNTFIEIAENVNIKQIKYIVFDFTNINPYNITVPKDYMKILKIITGFSCSWNESVKVIIITTDKEMRSIVTEIKKRSEELTWKYYLYETKGEAKTDFPNI